MFILWNAIDADTTCYTPAPPDAAMARAPAARTGGQRPICRARGRVGTLLCNVIPLT